MFFKNLVRYAAVSRQQSAQMTNRVIKVGVIHHSRFSTCQPVMARTLYTKDHEWLELDGDGIGTLGITDYAQKALGDVVFVETPIIGDVVKKNDQIGAIESVKAASDIFTPVSGEIINANEQLTDYPGLINKSPEDEGWFVKIKLSNHDEAEQLMDEIEYAAYCDTEQEHE
ncbi:glycine cleavage H-protein-domain-containing protein [Fennellomyces sp. T-0311]|nr:glycine cleavage H-protein-domain-containing protein [Fennellomyces sp. T-0311]